MKYLIPLLGLFLLLEQTIGKIESNQLRVAIVDSGLDLDDPRFKSKLCLTGHKDFTGNGIYDEDGHGTHIVSIILNEAKDLDYCIIIIKYWSPDNSAHKDMLSYTKALSYLEKFKPEVVNMSLSGAEFFSQEKRAIETLSSSIFIVAAGNKNTDAKNELYYPAALTNVDNNVIVVGSLGKNGFKASSSNYGYKNMKWEIGEDVVGFAIGKGERKMSGTSQATAKYTAHYLNKMFSSKPSN